MGSPIILGVKNQFLAPCSIEPEYGGEIMEPKNDLLESWTFDNKLAR